MGGWSSSWFNYKSIQHQCDTGLTLPNGLFWPNVSVIIYIKQCAYAVGDEVCRFLTQAEIPIKHCKNIITSKSPVLKKYQQNVLEVSEVKVLFAKYCWEMAGVIV